jgi:hypothetical protein
MKKIMMVLMISLVMVLSGCGLNYEVISENKVDGYDIYKVKQGMTCEAYFEDVYYSDSDYVYFYGYSGCSAQEMFLIKDGYEFIYLRDAIEEGLITVESLMAELHQRERYDVYYSEGPKYVGIDFYIDGVEVLEYASNTCLETGVEVLYVGDEYVYTYPINNCGYNHALYMYVNDEYVTVSSLLDDGVISFDQIKDALVMIDKDTYFDSLQSE